MEDKKDMPGLAPGALPTPPEMPGAKARALPTQIDVVATGKGFYKQQRIKEGDKFVVAKFEQLASYMRCVDPAIEKMRLQMMEERKQKVKAGRF